MKLIRMLKTMAGPDGVWHPGMKPFLVEDDQATDLVAAEAAEVVGGIDVGAREVAAVDAGAEVADAPKATKKAAAKKTK